MPRTKDDRFPRSHNYYDGLGPDACSREADRHHGLAVMLERLDDDEGAAWHQDESRRWDQRAKTLERRA